MLASIQIHDRDRAPLYYLTRPYWCPNTSSTRQCPGSWWPALAHLVPRTHRDRPPHGMNTPGRSGFRSPHRAHRRRLPRISRCLNISQTSRATGRAVGVPILHWRPIRTLRLVIVATASVCFWPTRRVGLHGTLPVRSELSFSSLAARAGRLRGSSLAARGAGGSAPRLNRAPRRRGMRAMDSGIRSRRCSTGRIPFGDPTPRRRLLCPPRPDTACRH